MSIKGTALITGASTGIGALPEKRRAPLQSVSEALA